MYAKVFTTLFDGSLRENWQAWVTFVALLILADENDEVDLTISALMARTGLPGSIVAEGIKILEQPDPHSRSPECEGRRIVRLDEHRPWGWRIVNRAKYKKIRDQSERRQYFQSYREHRKNQAQPVATQSNREAPEAVGSRQETEEKTPPCRWRDGFAGFWARYPHWKGRSHRKPSLAAWDGIKPKTPEKLAEIMAGLEVARASPDWAKDGGQFVEAAERWLRRSGWDSSEGREVVSGKAQPNEGEELDGLVWWNGQWRSEDAARFMGWQPTH